MDYDGNILGFLFRVKKKRKEERNISMTGGFTSVREEGEDPVHFLLSSHVDYRWAL